VFALHSVAMQGFFLFKIPFFFKIYTKN